MDDGVPKAGVDGVPNREEEEPNIATVFKKLGLGFQIGGMGESPPAILLLRVLGFFLDRSKTSILAKGGSMPFLYIPSSS